MRRGRIQICNQPIEGEFRSVISEEREDSGLYSARRGRIQVCNK